MRAFILLLVALTWSCTSGKPNKSYNQQDQYSKYDPDYASNMFCRHVHDGPRFNVYQCESDKHICFRDSKGISCFEKKEQ